MDWASFLPNQLPVLLVVIIGVPAVLAAYIVLGEFLVRRLPDGARPSVRPWIWVGPALVFVGLFLVYPVFGTIYRSLYDRHGAGLVGLGNYVHLLSASPG